MLSFGGSNNIGYWHTADVLVNLLVFLTLLQVRGQMSGMKTLSHSGSITTVDWHPTLPIFLTGSADHSVRVSSIL